MSLLLIKNDAERELWRLVDSAKGWHNANNGDASIEYLEPLESEQYTYRFRLSMSIKISSMLSPLVILCPWYITERNGHGISGQVVKYTSRGKHVKYNSMPLG